MNIINYIINNWDTVLPGLYLTALIVWLVSCSALSAKIVLAL